MPNVIQEHTTHNTTNTEAYCGYSPFALNTWHTLCMSTVAGLFNGFVFPMLALLSICPDV